MSSMRNAVQRRNHKERAQPKEREKWGILEKHKDYSLRAKDYNEKKKRLKFLRQKASERNPDEFHFAMMSSKTNDRGQKVTDRGNQELSHDTVKLLKTQDAGYLRTMAQQTRKIRQRLEENIFLDQDSGGNATIASSAGSKTDDRKHILYVGSIEDQREYTSLLSGTVTPPCPSSPAGLAPEVDSEESGDVATEANHSTRENTTSIDLMNPVYATAAQRADRKRRKRELLARQRHLEITKQREASLLAAENELELQRAKMHNRSGGFNKAGIKFKLRERKR